MLCCVGIMLLAAKSCGDNSVSSCMSHSRAKGPGASASAFSMARSLSGEGPSGPRGGAKGSYRRTPRWDLRVPHRYQLVCLEDRELLLRI
jgi:hypothetical protein